MTSYLEDISTCPYRVLLRDERGQEYSVTVDAVDELDAQGQALRTRRGHRALSAKALAMSPQEAVTAGVISHATPTSVYPVEQFCIGCGTRMWRKSRSGRCKRCAVRNGARRRYGWSEQLMRDVS